MLVKPLVLQSSGMAAPQPMMVGDILDSCDDSDPFVVDETAGGVTLTQAQFANSVSPALEVSGNAGAVATTLPTADQIIAAIKGNMNVIVPPANSPFDGAHDGAIPLQWPSQLGVLSPQQTFRFIVRNLNGAGNNTITAQASTGVTVVGTATLATNTWREYIVRVLCSAPTVIIGVTNLNASKLLNVADTETLKKVQPGQSAYGTNIAAGTKVVAVNYDTGVITVDTNTTGANASMVGITFTPTVTFTNLRAGTV